MVVSGLLAVIQKVVSTRLVGFIVMRLSSNHLVAASALLHTVDSVEFPILWSSAKV